MKFARRHPFVAALTVLWACGGASQAHPKPLEAPSEPVAGAPAQASAPAESAAASEPGIEDDVPDPTDADGDGFSDDIDLCPSLHAVTDDGCPLHVKMDEQQANLLLDPGIRFQLRKTTLHSDSDAALEDLRAALEGSRGMRIRIEAHTFDKGEPDEELALSAQRATVVRDWLVSRGIDAAQLEVYGCGRNRPRVPTRGRQRFDNRRVEVKVIRPLPPTGYPSTAGCQEVLPPAAPEPAQVAAAPAPEAESEPGDAAAAQAPAPEVAPEGPAAPTALPEAAAAPAAPLPAADSAPAAAPVAATIGGAGDRDGDDIPDASDRCPRTPGPRKLGGCAKRHRLELDAGRIALSRRVQFVKATPKLKPRTATLLGELAATLAANPEIHVRLEVRERDASLATARAQTVRSWLTERGGVATARVQAAGCTESPGKVTVAAAEGPTQLPGLPADCIAAAP